MKNPRSGPDKRYGGSGADTGDIRDGDKVDATKKYEKRPRRKTRPDRYDYKPEKTKKEVKISSKDSLRKHRSRKKTGDLLSKDFHAPNIESTRITLAQGHGPGIFNTGKTSTAVVQRGIPDLTFSEMSFLQKKRKIDHVRSERKESRKEAKRTRVTPEKITRFFDQSVDPRQSGSAHDTNDVSTRSERRHPNLHYSRSSPAKLGHERDDSIGTDDTRRHQAPSMISHGHSKGESHRRESSIMAGTTRSVPHRTVHPKPHQPPFSPARSRVWWPATPSVRLAHSAQQQHHPSVSNHEGELQLRNDVPRSPAPQPSAAPDSSHPHTISVSDPSVDHFTRGILLNRTATLEKHPTSVMHGNYLNLDDLKDISRIPELCHRLEHQVHPTQTRHFQNTYGEQNPSNNQLEPRQSPYPSVRTNDESVLPQCAASEPGRLQRCWPAVRNHSSHPAESNPVADFSVAKCRIMPQRWADTAATVIYPYMAYVEHSAHDDTPQIVVPPRACGMPCWHWSPGVDTRRPAPA